MLSDVHGARRGGWSGMTVDRRGPKPPGPPDFQSLFESAPALLLALAPDLSIVAASDAYLAATMTRREEILGRGIFEVFPDNPDDASADGTSNLRASLERVLATRAADTMAVQKYDVRGPDGSFQVKYWSPKNVPVRSASGELLYILHRVEDVTELVRASEMGEELRDRTREMEQEVLIRSRELAAANRDLRDANARLGELDAVKTAFFSNVSHEFRTPLTLMIGPLEDALSASEPALAGEALQMVWRNALRLMRLVNALLDFSRLEAGRLQASFEPTDLAVTTTYLASAFRSAVERVGLVLDVACDPLPEPVYVDRGLWEKVVLNLLSNALKFTFEGSIRVALRWCGDHVELEVRDTGTGIPGEELPHVFERFHRIQGARARTHEGSGIGLALVHDLVALHGGTVRVASTVGSGTTFTVSLRRGSAHLPPGRIREQGRDEDASAGARPFVQEALRWAGGAPVSFTKPTTLNPVSVPPAERERILVVDDNADLRDYMRSLLGELYVVETAIDGLEGMKAAELHRPDLILSDVMMPRMDGFALLRALRAHATLRSVPVILLSARAGDDTNIAGLEAGADDYLVKPFSGRELLARVRTHVELLHHRETLERFFALSLDMLCVASVDGYFKRVNPAFGVLGYTAEELTARPFLEFVHPEDRAATVAEIDKLAHKIPTLHFENRYRGKNGLYRWLAWTCAPDRTGTIFAVARDVTEEKQSREALEHAKEAADRANRELDAFCHSVAHDLRAPLRSLDGFSLALLEDFADRLDDEGKKHLSFIREAAQQMAQLIDDLLALSRVTRSELEREPVDLTDLARATVSRLQSRHAGRRVHVTIQEGLAGLGDPRLLTLVFDNLLGNAWKFTSKRDHARIEFGARAQDGCPVYFVADNGAGFDMTYANKLFGVFQRLHAASEFEGNGVGLATVQRIIGRHGGRVWAEAEVERGATFYFTLPEEIRSS